MADIFTDNTPRWLQAIARPADFSAAAKDIGMVFGGTLLGLQKDPDAEPVKDEETGEWVQPRKGFKQGLYEARMNQSDPNWRLKEKALESQAVGNWARAASAWQEADLNNRETAAWLTHDLPALYKYRDELKDNPSAQAPIMESTRGTVSLSKIQTGLSQATVAKTSAQTFQKMVEGLAQKGGQAAVIAGKYVNAIGGIPNQMVLQSFGKDLAALGLSESDLLAKTDLPVTSITSGPKGTTIKRGQEKAQSVIGKLQADREAALAAGNMDAVDELDLKISAEVEAAQPKFKTAPDGSTLAWMPGGKTLHVLKGNKMVELTPAQANKLAENANSDDDKDFFRQYAIEKGKEQTHGFTPKPKPASKSIFEKIGEFFGHKAAPASVTPTAAPATVSAAASTSTPALPTVTTKAQFDALGSGDIYVGEDGRKYRKP